MTKDKAGNEVERPHVTAQQILARTRERKAKSTLLIAIPDEHLARFHGIKDVKTLWAAIKTRFGGNAEYKKMEKNAIVLRHKVDILFMRVKQFYKKTMRKLEFNRKEPVGFDKTKVECFNYHRRGHFSRDCRTTRNPGNKGRDVGNAGYKERDNGKRPTREEYKKALVVLNGLGTYDWSYQLEKEATDFALMAFTSNPLSSSSLNSELDEALSKKEDLKAKLEKFDTSSKNLTKLLNSQINAKVKTGLGYDSQFNEKVVLDVKEEEVTEAMFDNRSSDEENSLANDRFKKGEGFHAVPPFLTGNYMPPKPDLSFARLDDSIYKFKINETVTSLSKDVKDASETSIAFVEKPKEIRTTAPLI
uniref:Ribonuclease H-like domain-containing protein n=1 Tax=Tanacetum cinerariifolium TaxID=118510 RepID=A0A6L2KC67_TANCI|nr:ribonuclease H-like domain-containing protein [Tanacetum cinerariifolium]